MTIRVEDLYIWECPTCDGFRVIDDPDATTEPKPKIPCPPCNGSGVRFFSIDENKPGWLIETRVSVNNPEPPSPTEG